MKTNDSSALRPGWVDRPGFGRALDIFPGALTWLFLLSPVVLSIIRPSWVAYIIIAFDLAWLQKSIRLSYNIIRGYARLRAAKRIDWQTRWKWVTDPQKARVAVEQQLYSLQSRRRPLLKCGRRRRLHQTLAAERRELERLESQLPALLDPRQIYHVVILATYNETYDILEASVEALTRVNFPLDRLILVIAYEERGGERTAQNARQLVERYGQKFAWVKAIKHPDGRPGEVRGKGGNITFAGRKLAAEIAQRGIDPEQVVVTTLDADNRPDPQYFSYLTYVYCTDPNRTHRSFQPIPMFYNNIWDAPPPILTISTGNSFWLLMETMRPPRLRNFSAHAQSLRTLLDTDFWSTATINEDGHQYWRTYFTYNGDHVVVPLYVPIYQDAVVAATVRRTFKVQYIQLRRWAWGITDFRYVVINYFKHPEISRFEKVLNVFRLVEGHFSWATAPLILAFAAWLPRLLNPQFNNTTLAQLLPTITSRILTVAAVGIVVTALLCFLSLPPRPPHYSRSKLIMMFLQWFLVPLTAIVFSAGAAIDAQTRLMFGRTLNWVVTEKVRKVKT